MALNTGIVIVQGQGTPLRLANLLPIAVFGTCSTGTISPGIITKIENQQQASTILGAGTAADTLPRAVGVLQRYGCGNIGAIKLVGADAAAQEADLIAKLDLLLTAPSVYREQIKSIIFPSFMSPAVINKAIDVATPTYATIATTFPLGTTPAQAISVRTSGAAGLGAKNSRLMVCHGHLRNATNPTTLEPLGTHLTGVLANCPYGKSPLGYLLKGVNGVDVPMVYSLSDESADPEKLNDAGVVSVNLSPDNQWVLWGGRNSIYTEGSVDPETFINVIRSRDEISILAKVRASKLLGERSNFSTASLLTESYRTMLGEEAQKGNILGYTKVEIDETQTNYAALRIWHNIAYQVSSPVELIGITVYQDLTNNTTTV